MNRTASTAAVISGGGSEMVSDFRPWATLRTLLGAREKSPPVPPGGGVALAGYFLGSRLNSRSRFPRSGIVHACRNQSNITTLAASSSAFLRRCRSGGTGSRIFQVCVEAAREKLFFHRFSFDDCSYPRPTSTPNDSDSRLPLRKLFSATSESSGHKINKSSRFPSVLQAVRFPSVLSRIGYIFPLSAGSRSHK